MAVNDVNMYGVDPHVAEIYDTQEDDSDDVELIRRLVGERRRLRILEPFCGTGRIFIPLARDGHDVTGLDQAAAMLERARERIALLPGGVRRRIALREMDATAEPWPPGFDLVVLGANCLYELATPEEQEGCIARAADSLVPGGRLYMDNDHMEGELDEHWTRPGERPGFPSGVCRDGALVESRTEVIWYDAARRLIRFRRATRVTLPDGSVRETEYEQQKHPPSTAEMTGWLETHGFRMLERYGDRAGRPYGRDSERAIFWAERP